MFTKVNNQQDDDQDLRREIPPGAGAETRRQTPRSRGGER